MFGKLIVKKTCYYFKSPLTAKYQIFMPHPKMQQQLRAPMQQGTGPSWGGHKNQSAVHRGAELDKLYTPGLYWAEDHPGD